MLTRVEMCEACALKCWPKLQLPSMQERVLLEEVASVLERCRGCVSQAGKLRAAARRSIGQDFWAWITPE